MDSPATKRKKCSADPTESIEPLLSTSVSIPLKTNGRANANPIDIFALNGDCLRNVCDYCSFADLYNMCIASDKLEIQIVQNAVRGRTVKFSELADSCNILDVFRIFGSNMTKLDIAEKDIQYKERKFSKFDEILRLISTHCSMDTIKHLTLQYCSGTTIKKRFLYASLPFFRGIDSLKIAETDQYSSDDCINYFESNCDYNPDVNNFVERIVSNAVNISSLQLHNLKLSGRLFYLQHMDNLKELSLDGCNIRVPDAFLSFVRGKPNLQSLTWSNSSLRGMDTNRSHSSNFVYELVAESMPDLAAFHYYPNEGFINDSDKYDSEFLFRMPDYSHLAKFNNLKELSIPGVTIAGLNVLAQKNTVEKLLTCFSKAPSNRNNSAYDFKFLQSFSSLKCIQLFTSFDDRAQKFNKELLTKAQYLTECYLDFFQIDEQLITIALESARNLSKLHISFRRGRFSTALYAKLRAIRSKHSSARSPLVICLEKKLAKQLLSRLKTNYRPDVIAVHDSV
ncbi:uncharacterized protein LOC119074605 [Bradysia coprophila]|uniref:uncharacterized protein LOC119074605 n=1 Tax=Bradysia coprophila TaxID=38358 RepID=UPI00187DC243|nr:uncharacterized protein LOC119074605 [Bradysia coprophila]